MVCKQSPIKLNNGGFLNWNSNTISNTKYWFDFLTGLSEKNYDKYYIEILDYLATDPDKLDFNPENKHLMKYYIDKNTLGNCTGNQTNKIPLLTTSKYYSKLLMFDYIGVKYFNYELD